LRTICAVALPPTWLVRRATLGSERPARLHLPAETLGVPLPVFNQQLLEADAFTYPVEGRLGLRVALGA
jgi:hypothetical protein